MATEYWSRHLASMTASRTLRSESRSAREPADDPRLSLLLFCMRGNPPCKNSKHCQQLARPLAQAPRGNGAQHNRRNKYRGWATGEERLVLHALKASHLSPVAEWKRSGQCRRARAPAACRRCHALLCRSLPRRQGCGCAAHCHARETNCHSAPPRRCVTAVPSFRAPVPLPRCPHPQCHEQALYRWYVHVCKVKG